MCLLASRKYPPCLLPVQARWALVWETQSGRYGRIFIWGHCSHHLRLHLWLQFSQGPWADAIHSQGDHSLGILSGPVPIPGRDGSQAQIFVSSEGASLNWKNWSLRHPSAPWLSRPAFAFEHFSLETDPGCYRGLTVVFICTVLSLITFKKQKQCFWLRG